MRQIVGIVAEYNPFHAGHAYQLRKLKAESASSVAVVMSTSFVQRGEMAMHDLFLRANAALQNGADVVCALPAVYSVSGAARFAAAGVKTLSLLGCDAISFGSGCDYDTLLSLQNACEEALSDKAFTGAMQSGMHFARARAEAVKQLYGAVKAALLDDANTALGLSYMDANAKLSHPMYILPIIRQGASHDAAIPENGFASGTYLRAHPEEWDKFLPCANAFTAQLKAGDCPDKTLHNRMMTAILKTVSVGQWQQTAGVSEGLEHLLLTACKNGMDIETILQRLKSKRYSMAALRRILCCGVLGITEAMQQEEVPAVWVLAANERGHEILARGRKLRKERGESQIVTPKFADFVKAAPQIGAVEQRAADLFGLCRLSGNPVRLVQPYSKEQP